MKQRKSPPPGWLAAMLVALAFFCNGTAMGQSFQHPYWVMAGDPPELFKNTGNGAITGLPFSTPAPNPNPGGISYTQRFATAANGVFDECGNPIFYIAGDWILDEDGQEVGYLLMKDRWLKWDDPNDLTDNTSPNPYTTENFEAVVCEVPARPGHYFIFCSNSSTSLSSLIVYQYDAVAKYLIPVIRDFNIQGFMRGYSTRFALSALDPARGRTLYFIEGNDLVEVTIPITCTDLSQLTASIRATYAPSFQESCPELELSHDGANLAWATFNGTSSVIHFFNLSSGQHTTFEPASGAMGYISGLEFLPDGRLAVALEWNFGVWQQFDGIGYFNQSLNGFSYVPGTATCTGGMLELGVSSGSGWQLYGITLNSVSRISWPPNGLPTLAGSVSFSPSDFQTYFGLANARPLPDQTDGESYPFSSACGDPGAGGIGDDKPDNWTQTEFLSPSFTFQPILTTITHE